MNVYEAIMSAADYIEKEQAAFNYGCIGIPKDQCGSPACAVGWIGYFANKTRGSWGLSETCRVVLGLTDESSTQYLHGACTPYVAFENRMGAISKTWMDNPLKCAHALRVYAKKFHAPSKPQRTDSELVADLMRKISTERIPEDVPA